MGIPCHGADDLHRFIDSSGSTPYTSRWAAAAGLVIGSPPTTSLSHRHWNVLLYRYAPDAKPRLGAMVQGV
jgi:hypothetical protein